MDKKNNWYRNPQNIWQSLAKTGIQILDPTGVSSWGDLKDSYNTYSSDPTFGNAMGLLINGVSALPIIGKIPKGIKLIKGVTTAGKIGNVTSNINKAIDSVPELIPYLREATAKIQNLSTYAANRFIPRNYNIRQNYNIGVDVLNSANAAFDVFGTKLKFNKNENDKKEVQVSPKEYENDFSRWTVPLGWKPTTLNVEHNTTNKHENN